MRFYDSHTWASCFHCFTGNCWNMRQESAVSTFVKIGNDSVFWSQTPRTKHWFYLQEGSWVRSWTSLCLSFLLWLKSYSWGMKFVPSVIVHFLLICNCPCKQPTFFTFDVLWYYILDLDLYSPSPINFNCRIVKVKIKSFLALRNCSKYEIFVDKIYLVMTKDATSSQHESMSSVWELSII